MDPSLLTFTFAFFGGLLPAALWMWFFEHEDPHPEPRSMLVKTFIAGMVTVFVAMAFEEILLDLIGGDITSTALLGWAIIEESLKFAAVWLVALRTRFLDEPVDALIYMIAVALGFAALENSFFLISPISEAAFLDSVLTGGLRFIGATLVHVVSSGALGACIAFAFYKRKRIKREAVVIGLAGAVLLHWGFNLLIMEVAQSTVLRIFGLVWIAVIILMLVFERVKRMTPAPYPPK